MTSRRPPRRLTFVNVVSALALFVALSTGGAYAAGYIVSSNRQVGPNTISGHQPPAGYGANVVAGSIRADDIAPHTIAAGQLAAPEGWHAVAAFRAAGLLTDPCASQTAIFCGVVAPYGAGEWKNAGGSFAPAGFYRDLEGGVHLRGLVSMASVGYSEAEIFVLPAGYRPAHELVFATVDNDAKGSYPARVDVDPDGSVHVVSGNYTFLSLDSISFRAGQ